MKIRVLYELSGQQYRVIVVDGVARSIEYVTTDEDGGPSWQRDTRDPQTVARVLALALQKSQMTPLQRIEHPNLLHPEGVEWSGGDVTIRLGRIE